MDYPDGLLDQETFLLTRISMAARRRLTERLAERGLTRWDVAVLVLLAERGPTVQRRVGEQLGIDQSDLVEIIDGLLAAGTVSRERDEADRRRYILTITTEGRAALRRARREEKQVTDELLAPLGAAERTAWSSALRRIYERL